MGALDIHEAAFHKVLVFAPFGRDGDAVRSVLDEDAVTGVLCERPDDLYDAIDETTLLLVITEEGLATCSQAKLLAQLQAQPIWSDIPILALTGSKSAPSAGTRLGLLASLGNVTMIHRPLAREALRMALTSARRTRYLQYKIRDQLSELNVHAVDLERRVKERSDELAHAIEQKNRAETALLEARQMEALGRLTSGVAHDFNNLMQVVSGAVELLKMMTRADHRIERILASISRATGKGALLTRQLLAYGRRQALATRSIDLHARLGELVDALRYPLPPDITLAIRLGQELWHLQADPAQLEAALLNLVINARDAMPKGGVMTLSIENCALPDDRHTAAGIAPGDYVCLSIEDKGSGMSAEIAARAFDPFFTTKAPGAGTGLGLSQVQGFARQSGGYAFIEHAHGGTIVGMLLPRGAAATSLRAPAPASDDVSLPPGLRVLCVEDDAAVAELAASLLASLGCEVTQAIDAQSALANDIGQFDVVFSDVMMPGQLDGIGMSIAMRARRPELPIILASGYILAPERLQGITVELIQKPYSLKDITQAMARALQL